MKTIFRSVEQEWSEYERMVLDPSAGEIQRRETRRAFMAGYFAAMTALVSMPEGIDDELLVQSLEDHYEETKRVVEHA